MGTKGNPVQEVQISGARIARHLLVVAFVQFSDLLIFTVDDIIIVVIG
jgi:hypothetical protein